MSDPQHPADDESNEGVDPDMEAGELTVHGESMGSIGDDPVSAVAPDSPTELIAMQQKPERPEKSGRSKSPKVRQVLELIETLDTQAWEDQQIALAIVQHLERYHDEVVAELVEDSEASHSQLACWAIDADRLMNSRRLLESVDLD